MSDLPVVNIKPGELYVSEEPCRITTLLGSCVSVTVHNQREKFGGMNHFMLPREIPSRRRGPRDFRFGDRSTKTLIDRMLDRDPDPSRLVVKLFGGGKVVEALAGSEIGASNVTVAREVLEEYGLSPAVEYVEGFYGMKLDFNTRTNKVRVQDIKRSDDRGQKLRSRESKIGQILSGDGDEDRTDLL